MGSRTLKIIKSAKNSHRKLSLSNQIHDLRYDKFMNQQELFSTGLEISKAINEVYKDIKKIKIKIPNFSVQTDDTKSGHQSSQGLQSGMDYSDYQYSRPETSSRKFVKTNSQKLKSKRLYVSIDKQNNSIQKIDK